MIEEKRIDKLSIEKFKKYFLGKVTHGGKYVKYENGSDFTKCVKDAMEDLAKECDLISQPEYYSVDYTFWEKTPDDNKQLMSSVGMNGNANWNLFALVEHENNKDDWHYEVQKLAPFCCPLRIVIGYRNKKYSDKERLECVSKLLTTMKRNNCFCDKGAFWVIIGNTGHGEANYVFYRYDANNDTFAKE